MLYYNEFFSNYEEFKAMFGLRVTNNGDKCRNNALMLEQIKYRPFFEAMRDRVLGGKNSMVEAVVKGRSSVANIIGNIIEAFSDSPSVSLNWNVSIPACNIQLYSPTVRTDSLHGVCEDGSVDFVRYINIKQGKVFKMRCGKFFRKVVLEQPMSELVSPKLLNYMCEDFASKFHASLGGGEDYTLHTGEDLEDFKRIYCPVYTIGDFHSCMTDKDYHSFYKDAVYAKAAWLEDREGEIVARCVIFTDVRDQNDKVWRIAERQYSSDGDETLKRILISKLIMANEIDAYKAIGAGCHDATNIESVDGKSLSDCTFRIECNLGYEDTVSYQDTFKWYDMDNRMAYNHSVSGCEFSLDITDGSLESNWDEYHDRYTRNDVVEVWVHGDSMYCDEDDLEDFIRIGGCYYHKDDCTRCDYCNEWVVKEDAYCSEPTGEYYCCSSCLNAAEENYKSEHWYYSDWDEEYYENQSEVVTYHLWRYGHWTDFTISVESVEECDDTFIEIDGEWYRYDNLDLDIEDPIIEKIREALAMEEAA